MQIKKFTGASLKEAAEKMKTELGSEALILSSRLVKNLPGDKVYEITAGIENSSSKTTASSEKERISPVQGYDNYTRTRKSAVPEPVKTSEAGNEIKNIIHTLANQEVNKTHLTAIINELKKYKSFLHPSNIDNYVISAISSLLPQYSFNFKKSDKPKTVALVGPTGVGKTTCIAKIAVIAKIIHNLKVGLISADTYRLGAIDQLKIFSEISNIEMLVAYSPEEMMQHYNSFKDKDIIFIDTAGRSQKNFDQIMATAEILKSIDVDDVFLVMSASASTRTMYDIVEKFKPLKYNAAIFSKIDEAVVFGNILNTILKYKLPTVYLTNGQVIPDDILAGEPDFIGRMIYKGAITK